MRRGSARVHGGAPGRCANARTTGCGERRAGDAKSEYSDALTGEMAARTLPPLCLSIPNRANAARFSFLCPRPSVRAPETLSRDSCPAAGGDSHMRRPTAPGRGQGYDGLHRNADERCVRRRAGESGHERAKTVFNLNTCNTRGVAQQESGLYLRGATMAVQVRILPPRPN